MAENNEGWEVWAERLPDVETKQELPEGVWEDYKKYQMLNNREGDWSAPEMKNPDALTKIRNLMSKVKDLPNTMSYYAHKVADPMYANVDYMGQQVGDWAAKKINNIARAFDVSPEARQYGRFEEEEYDPEAVDVRFGRNAYKEGYDNLGDYLEAKDQEKVDRYRGYNHANRFAPIENADEQFYTLSDTQTMEDWQPETTSGKIAKGAIETAGNMLPENLKALMEEKGIEGGAKMLGMLSPIGKSYVEAMNDAKKAKAEGDIAEAQKWEAVAKMQKQNAEWEGGKLLDKDSWGNTIRPVSREQAIQSPPAQKAILRNARKSGTAYTPKGVEQFGTEYETIAKTPEEGKFLQKLNELKKEYPDVHIQYHQDLSEPNKYAVDFFTNGRQRFNMGSPYPMEFENADDLARFVEQEKNFSSAFDNPKRVPSYIKNGGVKPLPNPAKQSKAITRPSEGRFVPAYKERFGRDLKDDLNYIAEKLSPEELDDFIYKYRGYEPYQDFTGNTKARAELVNETVKRLMKAEAPMAQSADFKDAIQRAKNIVQDYGYEGESINTALENAIANRLANLTAEEISNYSLRPNTADTAIYVANKAVEDLMDSGVIR